MSHQHLYKLSSKTYDLVLENRYHKASKYNKANFTKTYDMPVCIFSVSTLGCIHPQTEKEMKTKWLPYTSPISNALLHELQKDIRFSTLKSLGNVLHMAQVRASCNNKIKKNQVLQDQNSVSATVQE